MEIDVDFSQARYWNEEMPERMRWLRENEPVFWSEATQAFIISRFEDVVHVSKNHKVFCSGEGVIPGSWTVIDNEGNGMVWMTNADWGDGNYTNGSGLAAATNSDTFGTAEYDTELVTHAFTVPGGATLGSTSEGTTTFRYGRSEKSPYFAWSYARSR